MKKILTLLVMTLISQTGWSKPQKAAVFKISSPALKAGGVMPMDHVFNSFGCEGKNISPELNWQNAPKDTQSFAITMYDPDAPTGSGWWHWSVFNISPNVNQLKAGAGNSVDQLPEGSAQARTDFGKPGYGGPCPPVGDKPHRYYFTVHALKVPRIDLTADASGAMLGYYLNQNTIKKATIMVKYGRKAQK